jgi:hypothetical protein
MYFNLLYGSEGFLKDFLATILLDGFCLSFNEVVYTLLRTFIENKIKRLFMLLCTTWGGAITKNIYNNPESGFL